jgi:hypothetical protein
MGKSTTIATLADKVEAMYVPLEPRYGILNSFQEHYQTWCNSFKDQSIRRDKLEAIIRKMGFTAMIRLAEVAATWVKKENSSNLLHSGGCCRLPIANSNSVDYDKYASQEDSLLLETFTQYINNLYCILPEEYKSKQLFVHVDEIQSWAVTPSFQKKNQYEEVPTEDFMQYILIGFSGVLEQIQKGKFQFSTF